MNKINKEILRLATPAIITNITVPLLGLVDLAIVGHMGHENYIAAVSVGSMIFNVIYWLMGFLRMGTGGLTAQAYGMNKVKETARLYKRSMLLGVLLGGLFILLQWPILKLSLYLMGPQADIIPLVSRYFHICIWGAPAILSLYGLTGWFIGMQNTKATMVVSISQNLINIGISLLLVYVFGMKIEGVAIGTLIAAWSGLFIALFLIRTRYSQSLHFVVLSWHKLVETVKVENASIDRDIFVRTVFLVGVNLFFTAAGARQSNVILSVNTLLMSFFMLFSYFMDGFAYAAEAMCGKAYGALLLSRDDASDLRKNQWQETGGVSVVRALFSWGAMMVFVFTVLYILFANPFLAVLTSEHSVIRESQSYLPWIFLVPLTGVAAFLYDGIYIGITATRSMMWSTVVAAISFFAVYFLFRPLISNHALWLALHVYMVLRGGLQWWFYRRMFHISD